MRKGIQIAAVTCLAVASLTGCQTPEFVYRFAQVAPGPDFESARAYCTMQGYTLPRQNNVYIGGDPFQNNWLNMQQQFQNQGQQFQFYNACMRTLGWGLVPVRNPDLPPA